MGEREAPRALQEENARLREENARLREENARLRATAGDGGREGASGERELLDAVMHTSVAMITVLNTAGEIIFANDQAEKLLGLTKDKLLGRSYDAPEWKATALDGGPWVDDLQPFTRVMRSGEPVFDMRHAIEWPNGKRRLLSINGAPIKDARGEIVRIVFSVADITERVRTEQILQRIVEGTAATGHAYIESLVQALAESLEVRYAFVGELAGAQKDQARTIAVWADGALAPNFEYALAGTPCDNMAEAQLCFYRSGVTALFPDDALLQKLGADSYLGVPLLSSGGQVLGLLVVMNSGPIDESLQPEAILRIFAGKVAAEIERQYAEEELRRSDERLRQAARMARLGIWEWDIATGSSRWSEEMFEIYGIPPESFSGKVSEAEQYTHPEDREDQQRRTMEVLEAAAESHRPGARAGGFAKVPLPQTAEFRIVRPDGEVRTVVGQGLLAMDADGKPQQFVGTLLDITDRKRAEEERAALRAQLVQAQKLESIGRLAGGVAHDFNNLLTAILCYAELGQQRAAGDALMHGYLQQISDAGTRGARLTGQLLAFARKQVLEPKVLDLNELVSQAADMLQRLIGEDVDLVWLPTPGVGRVKVDPGQLEQILINLVVNARDAMPDGGRVTIETADVTLTEEYASRREEVTPGEYVMLAVTDTGIGMSAETLAMVFEPFFTTKEAGKGTGLGLATCYGIVKQHRGHIAVYSEPGQGTTFRVYLPRAQDVSALRSPTPARGPAATGHETVLVVEDYGPVRHMVREVLSSLGYTVLVAADGEEALRVSRSHPGEIDLLVTDVVMPRLGGKDLATALRRERPDLRVLYSSGYTENAIVQQGTLKPGVAFIPKPYRPSDFADKVRSLLDSPAGREP